MPIAVLGHPVGAGEMGFPGAAGAIRLAARIKVQHDPRNLFPIGAVGFRVEQAQIRDLVPLVIAGQSGRSRRRVGDIWVDGGFCMDDPEGLKARIPRSTHYGAVPYCAPRGA